MSAGALEQGQELHLTLKKCVYTLQLFYSVHFNFAPVCTLTLLQYLYLHLYTCIHMSAGAQAGGASCNKNSPPSCPNIWSGPTSSTIYGAEQLH